MKSHVKSLLHHNTIHRDLQSATVREIVFGAEDGMVSTLGALTGIAAGSQDPYVVILAGLVIVSVESISMGIGSYISNRSENDMESNQLSEEKQEIRNNPEHEQEELTYLFIQEGWSEQLAISMAKEAVTKKPLMLQEMAYRELHITTENNKSPRTLGLYMFGAYICGGMVPLIPYLVFPLSVALPLSITLTLIGLFTLGALTTRFTKGSWKQAGLRVFLLGTVAFTVGLLVGQLATLLER